uniref:Uncharacterized protein n=1 Tax=Panagrolaimus sp. PS1159 TaxID=55785 RepID=A0AC35GUU9_9BILA
MESFYKAVELVEFDPSEIEALDEGIRRATASPIRRRDHGVELVSFTEEEEDALRKGWEGVRNFRNKAPQVQHTRVSSENYCIHYRANYAYYCIGSTYGREPLIRKVARFC